MSSALSRTLVQLLDDSKVYDREQWAEMLGVSTGTIKKWIEEEVLPQPVHLLLIYNLLKVRKNNQAINKALYAFEFYSTRPAGFTSPLGDAMLPDIATYMFRPVRKLIKFLKKENLTTIPK